MIDKDKLMNELSEKIVAASVEIIEAQEDSIEYTQANERVAAYTEIIDLVDSMDQKPVKETTLMVIDSDMNTEYFSQIIGETIASVVDEEMQKINREREKEINRLIAKGNAGEAIDLMFG